MGQILNSLRQEFADDTPKTFWGQIREKLYGEKEVKVPKDAHVLYISARMRDAEQAQKNAEALAAAIESAALKIIGRYDPRAAKAFYAEIQERKRYYL